MNFDTQQAFALILAELKEMHAEINQILDNIENNIATKDQIESIMEAITTTNNNLSNKIDNLSPKDTDLESDFLKNYKSFIN